MNKIMPDKLGTGGSTPKDEIASSRMNSGIKRPLVPVVLALMLGLTGAAWGVHIPKVWLVIILAGLLVIMLLLFFYAPSGSHGKNPPSDTCKPTE